MIRYLVNNDVLKELATYFNNETLSESYSDIIIHLSMIKEALVCPGSVIQVCAHWYYSVAAQSQNRWMHSRLPPIYLASPFLTTTRERGFKPYE
jgi:hypothetical protein